MRAFSESNLKNIYGSRRDEVNQNYSQVTESDSIGDALARLWVR